MPVRSLEGMPREEGVRDLVIAWTLSNGSAGYLSNGQSAHTRERYRLGREGH